MMICRLLLVAAQVLMLVGTAAAASSDSGGGCIRRVGELSNNKYGSCQCYRKCSDPEKGWLSNAASQRCFVDCVLKQGCGCPGDDGVPVKPAPAPPPPPPPTTMVERYYCEGRTSCLGIPVPGGFPVLMTGTTLRVTVPRPKRCRGSIEKAQEEEMLVVESSFVPGEPDFSCIFIVQVYSESQREIREDKLRDSKVQLDVVIPMLHDEPSRSGRSAMKIPIGDRVQNMGADCDKTIVVLLFQPRKIAEEGKGLGSADIYNEHKLTIRDVRIEYERKAS